MPDQTPTQTPGHPTGRPAAPWWRHGVIYQVYPRSFADSSGDGIGDLPGVTAHLDHLVDLGVDAVWLSPFYPSPQADAGYDVSDYRDVDPVFGTLADFDAMVAAAHSLGLRVVVDLVPNHTSDEHAWFRAAVAAAPGSPERARYLFRDGRGASGDEPPNNWQSNFGGPAWTRLTEPDGTPGQWYLHLFDSRQPDLDWANPEVLAEFLDVLRFWLDRGVDGFRVDVAHGLVKVPGLPDWDGVSGAPDDYDPTLSFGGDFGPMWDQDGVHEIYRRFRAVLDEYDGERAMVAEAVVVGQERRSRYVRPDEFHQAFNFDFLTARWGAEPFRDVIVRSLQATAGVGAPTTWVLSNHDVVRHTTRLGLPVPGGNPAGVSARDPQPDEELGLRRARAASVLMLALPGSAYLWQGEELGLPEHTLLEDEHRQDPIFARTGGEQVGRDGTRVPVPWTADGPSMGFSSTGASWLPQPESFRRHAADVERADPASTLSTYRATLRLRREHALGLGSLTWLETGPDVLGLRNGDVTVVVNFGAEPVPLPEGTLLLESVPGAVADGALAPDATAWVATG